MKIKQRRILGLLTVTLFLFLTGCSSSEPKSNSQPKIVTSVDFYGEVVRAVAGHHAQVTSIIDKPSTDPHDFEATTKDAKAIGTANLIVYNGLGYDDWMNRAAQNKQSDAQIIRVGEDVQHLKNGANEHVWYAPKTMSKLAGAIAKKLSGLDSKNRATYQKNARHYQQSLRPLTTSLNKIKHQSAGQSVAVSEPVFDYALKAMGYKISNQSFSLAIENGTDPSPTEISQLQTAIKQHKIAFFVENTQSDSNIVTNMVELAKKSNVPVIKVTETLPANTNYLQWMLAEYQQVEKTQK